METKPESQHLHLGGRGEIGETMACCPWPPLSKSVSGQCSSFQFRGSLCCVNLFRIYI